MSNPLRGAGVPSPYFWYLNSFQEESISCGFVKFYVAVRWDVV
jgi:hypothetical protein